jgi:hypothetical protein
MSEESFISFLKWYGIDHRRKESRGYPECWEPHFCVAKDDLGTVLDQQNALTRVV